MDPLKPIPKLQDNLIIVKQIERGEAVYVFKVPETGNYYRFTEFQHQLITLLDGKRTLEEMAEAFPDMVGDFNVVDPLTGDRFALEAEGVSSDV